MTRPHAMRSAFLAAALALTATWGAPLRAESPAPVDARAEIASKIPGTKPEDLHPSPIAGVYELARGADIAYVSSDAKYVIAGDLYDLAKNDNLTETRRRDTRMKLLADVPESEMLIFGPSPQDTKYTVTVFTDVDCGYCQKLHSQIAEYNRLGIKVRYLFYPRTGPHTESWAKAERVWCSPNRNDALTRAKRGEVISAKPCGATPVAREYALGQSFGLRGTPAIVLANGDMLPGYLPPPLLAQRVKEVGR
jgi:thiol:disulfide interchange protein DsbC